MAINVDLFMMHLLKRHCPDVWQRSIFKGATQSTSGTKNMRVSAGFTGGIITGYIGIIGAGFHVATLDIVARDLLNGGVIVRWTLITA
jgi:hypothetical protein